MFYQINFFKKFNFISLKIIVDTLIDDRNETSKHDFLKSVKIKTKPCFPTRMFQSVLGHSSEQSTTYYSLRPTVSRLKGVSDSTSD